jgi:hypothetical protein
VIQVPRHLRDRLSPLDQIKRWTPELRRLGCRQPELLSEAIITPEQVSGKRVEL